MTMIWSEKPKNDKKFSSDIAMGTVYTYSVYIAPVTV